MHTYTRVCVLYVDLNKKFVFFVLLGNNLYNSELSQVLEEVKGSTERMAYILMDKIHPAPVQNILLRRDGPLQVTSCLSELGAFGAYVRYEPLTSRRARANTAAISTRGCLHLEDSTLPPHLAPPTAGGVKTW